MKKKFFLLLALTLLITGCSIPDKNTLENSSSQLMSEKSETSLEEPEEGTTQSEEIVYAISLESEVDKMQHIIFTTALASLEYEDNKNIYNENILWKSVYYYLNNNYKKDTFSVEEIGNIFNGFFGINNIPDNTILEENMISLNRKELTYTINKSNISKYTYYISDYKFDKTDIVMIINLYDKNEESVGSFEFILEKTNKITHINNMDYKYKIKEFKILQ